MSKKLNTNSKRLNVKPPTTTRHPSPYDPPQKKVHVAKEEPLSMKELMKDLPKGKMQPTKPTPISHGFSVQKVTKGHMEPRTTNVRPLKGSAKPPVQEQHEMPFHTNSYGGSRSSFTKSSMSDW